MRDEKKSTHIIIAKGQDTIFVICDTKGCVVVCCVVSTSQSDGLIEVFIDFTSILDVLEFELISKDNGILYDPVRDVFLSDHILHQRHVHGYERHYTHIKALEHFFNQVPQKALLTKRAK